MNNKIRRVLRQPVLIRVFSGVVYSASFTALIIAVIRSTLPELAHIKFVGMLVGGLYIAVLGLLNIYRWFFGLKSFPISGLSRKKKP